MKKCQNKIFENWIGWTCLFSVRCQYIFKLPVFSPKPVKNVVKMLKKSKKHEFRSKNVDFRRKMANIRFWDIELVIWPNLSHFSKFDLFQPKPVKNVVKMLKKSKKHEFGSKNVDFRRKNVKIRFSKIELVELLYFQGVANIFLNFPFSAQNLSKTL